MGLHPDQLKRIQKKLGQFEKVVGVEFGSGGSTEFFEKIVARKFEHASLTTFDHSSKFAYIPKSRSVSLRIRELETFSEKVWERSFAKQSPPRNGRPLTAGELKGFRQKNAFYALEPGDIPLSVNYVLLDGPNGNGRSAAFLHLKGNIDRAGALCMVDDVHHYDFEDRLFQVFPNSEMLARVVDREIGPNYGWGMYWVLDGG